METIHGGECRVTVRQFPTKFRRAIGIQIQTARLRHKPVIHATRPLAAGAVIQTNLARPAGR